VPTIGIILKRLYRELRAPEWRRIRKGGGRREIEKWPRGSLLGYEGNWGGEREDCSI